MISFRLQPFESKYQAEVIALIEQIQDGEFSLPIKGGQRKETPPYCKPMDCDEKFYWLDLVG